jgi:adenylate cyclase class 2
MIEVEMKFSSAGFDQLETRLRQWCAREEHVRNEVDHYFNPPDRDFGVTDEAFRLRRAGPINSIAYKGPKHDHQTKTRTEIEVALAPGDDAAESFVQLVKHLGYGIVGVVHKRRRVYSLEREGLSIEVCLDEVQGLGRFVELEVIAPAELVDKARDLLLRLAPELGLGASERRSYLELLLESKKPK